MEATGFPTSADIYLELDGRKIAVVQGYTCLLYTSYRSAYSGVFYRRFVLGEWTAAQGRVYDFFDRDRDKMCIRDRCCTC